MPNELANLNFSSTKIIQVWKGTFSIFRSNLWYWSIFNICNSIFKKKVKLHIGWILTFIGFLSNKLKNLGISLFYILEDWIWIVYSSRIVEYLIGQLTRQMVWQLLLLLLLLFTAVLILAENRAGVLTKQPGWVLLFSRTNIRNAY